MKNCIYLKKYKQTTLEKNPTYYIIYKSKNLVLVVLYNDGYKLISNLIKWPPQSLLTYRRFCTSLCSRTSVTL